MWHDFEGSNNLRCGEILRKFGTSKFPSVNAIKMQLTEEFNDQVPDSTSTLFQVGYLKAMSKLIGSG